jgi:NAD(P) transhydrogenase subunit beta
VIVFGSSFLQDPDFIDGLYILAVILFIVGLRGLAGPQSAVRGNKIAAVGMAVAVVATLLKPGVIPDTETAVLMALGVAVGTAVGVPAARSVKMTAMPQMVALFNGVGGGAVA